MRPRPVTADPVVVIGAGPAGLTAAIELLRLGRQVVVVEESHSVGGLSRTVEHDGTANSQSADARPRTSTVRARRTGKAERQMRSSAAPSNSGVIV